MPTVQCLVFMRKVEIKLLLLKLLLLPKLLISFQVLDCLEVDTSEPVKHSYESVLIAEKYEIV
jgi:hypothetical protein